MEHIKKAVEKARKARQAAGETAGSESPALQPRRGDTGSKINYTQTRLVPISEGVLRQHRIAEVEESSEFYHACKMMRTRVLQQMRKAGWKAVGVTSVSPGEGKSITAINLAIGLSREIDHTVLLVDANLSHPAVHDFFGVETPRGLTDHLIDHVPLGELLVSPVGMEGFVLLPGGRPISNSSELLGSSEMAALVQELNSRYEERLVVYDLPPALSRSDTLAISPYVDATILVVEDGRTREEEIRHATELLGDANLIGVVLNKVHVNKKSENSGGFFNRLFRSARK